MEEMFEELARIKKACPLVAKSDQPRQIRVGNALIGSGRPIVIAGPCAVESREQFLTTAESVKAAGALGLRGGIFKPRTSPYSFQGLAQDGVELLWEAREATGLFIVAEVTSPEDVAIAEEVVDVFQVGARNMQNFALLRLLGKKEKPVLLKRGLSATIMEWLQAAEYILAGGNPNVILCERGIRTFETMTRNTLDLNGVALVKALSDLPVLVDPSHGTGRRDLILPAAKAGLATGADGLMIEVHPDPDKALSDGDQSLDFAGFHSLMRQLSLYPVPTAKVHRTTPNAETAANYFEQGHRYVPLSRTIPADLETPVSVYLKLTQGSRRFLLESVTGGERPGRYSYIGWDPLVSFISDDQGVYREMEDGRKVMATTDILTALEEAFATMNVAPRPDLLGFYGGGVGYLGYDYVRRIEHLPVKRNDPLGLPESYWMIPRRLVIFDHASQQISLIYLRAFDETAAQAEASLDQMERDLARSVSTAPIGSPAASDQTVQSTFSREEYRKAVRQGIEAIRAGEIFQVVLSQRLSRPYRGDPFSLYRILRRINPSPYLFIINHEDFSLVGSSPEAMVRLNDGEIILSPIAGTRPRGKDRDEDGRHENELLADPKERAEHIMLVDLGRNDVGRVAKFGSVHVEELMHVERYSHVMHIVSDIKGELIDGKKAFDLLRATFPAGTVSGAPKVRAMQIIDELEPVRRGPYAGAVGYIGFNGDLNTGIIIRTVILHKGWAHIQAGAGIVADSDPDREYEETMFKAEALLKAVRQAEEGMGEC
jgi:anthranilate synthase component 1